MGFQVGDVVRVRPDTSPEHVGVVTVVYPDSCDVKLDNGLGYIFAGFTILISNHQLVLVSRPYPTGTTQQPLGCAHEYKVYMGLRESFEYCQHCDRKRDDILAEAFEHMKDKYE